MTLVDTSFLLALAQPRDALHARATAWSEAIADQLLVTEYVLCEIVNHLSKPVDRPRAHVLVAQLRSGLVEFVPSSPDLLEAGLQLHAQRPDKDWSLTDCVSFVVMKQCKVTQALTHDHHFEQAGFEALLRRDP